MADITQYVGGQIVTDTSGTGERQFIIDNDFDKDMSGAIVTPTTGVAGNIYITTSIITNSAEITAFVFTDTSQIGRAGGNRIVRVTGEEGAQYTLSYASGASGDTSLQTIPASGTQDTTVTISTNPNSTSPSTRNPSVTITVNASSDPETVLVDNVMATISIEQEAGIMLTPVRARGSMSITSIAIGGTTYTSFPAMVPAGTYSMTVSGTYTVTTAAANGADTTAQVQARQLGGSDRANFTPTLQVGARVTNRAFTVNSQQNYIGSVGERVSFVADVSEAGFFADLTLTTFIQFT